MKSLLLNPFFWAGEIGLLIVVIACLAIIELVKPTASKWYVFALYAVAVSGVWSIGQPVISTSILPHSAYVFRTALGFLFFQGYRQLTTSKNYPLGEAAARAIHRIFIFGGVVSFFVLLSVGLVIMIRDQKEMAAKLLEDQIQEHTETMQTIRADTTIKKELRLQIDSVRTDLKQAIKDAKQSRATRQQILKKADAIKRDTEILKKKAVTKKDTSIYEKRKGFLRRIFGFNGNICTRATIGSC